MTYETEFAYHTPDEFNEAELVGVFETGTSAWHEAREDGLGGSEIGTVLGLNPYMSAYALWAKKTGKIPEEKVDNWSVRFGNAFEKPLLALWGHEHPEYEVFLTGTYKNPSQPYLRANPDALARHRETGEWVVVEIKTARLGWDATPPAYEAQITHYMDVLGIKRAVIVAIAGWTWEERWYEYDEFLASVQRSAAARFWHNVVNDTKPEFDGAESTYQAVRAMHPDIDTEAEVEIDGGHTLILAAQEFAAAQEKLNKIKSEVLDLMGDAKHAYIEHDGKKIRIASRQARRDGVPYLVLKGV
jgi:putative phage-type endonuclease